MIANGIRPFRRLYFSRRSQRLPPTTAALPLGVIAPCEVN